VAAPLTLELDLHFTTKGVPAMDIYSILSSKPHNPHYLNRYITFIKQCQQKNVGYEGYVEYHHICPKAKKDMFPEYEDFRLHPWNRAVLTARQHFIAHIILSKAFYKSSSQKVCLWFMMNTSREDIKITSRTYEKVRKNFAKFSSEMRKGTITVKDKLGNTFRVSTNAQRYLSGELIHITKGKATVKDKEGNASQVDLDDPRYLSGELVPITKDTTTVKDKDGNIFRVQKDDPRYLSGELTFIMKGKVTVKDAKGNISQVDLDDPRYLSGELVFISKGKVIVKDTDGNISQVDLDDPRYLSGELKSISYGYAVVKDEEGKIHKLPKNDKRIIEGKLKHIAVGNVTVKDKNGNTLRVQKDDPRYLSGELVHITSGTIMITNGVINKRILPTEKIPHGFTKGMTKRKTTVSSQAIS
jgi:uncharacterized cupin superfamily protein